MEQVATNIQQNSDNAQQTEKISSEAASGLKDVADKAGDAISEQLATTAEELSGQASQLKEMVSFFET